MKTYKFLVLLITFVLVGCGGDGGGDDSFEIPEVIITEAKLQYPSNMELCSPVDLTFEWVAPLVMNGEADDISYEFFLGTKANDLQKLKSFNINHPMITGLEKSTVYYWQVKSTIDDISSMSDTYSFQTTGDSESSYIPNEPSEEIPINGLDTLTEGIIDLSWQSVDGDSSDVLSYEIYLDNKPQPQSTNFIESIKAASKGGNAKTKSLTKGRYYWQVKVTDTQGNTNISPVWNFTII